MTERIENQATTADVAALLYSLVAYGAFIASFGFYWVAFLADRWIPVTVDRRPAELMPTFAGALLDLALILLFGLQHSVMARPAFKRIWTRIIPPVAERSTYVLLSSLFLGILMAFWQPWPALVWDVEWIPARLGLWTLFALGLASSVVASFQIDHFGLFGLRQPWNRLRRKPWREPDFVEPSLYRLVRHPIQTGVLMMLWSAPTMTAGRLLLASAMTLYILIGLYFEERNLVQDIGERYRAYRRRVPGLLPRPGIPAGGRWAAVLMLVLLIGVTLAATRAGAAATPDAQTNGVNHGSFGWDGRLRRYAVYEPGTLTGKADSVLVLHGSGGDIARIRKFAGRRLEALADEQGFRVIYARGFEGNWNGCRSKTPFSAKRLGVDDVGFLRELLERETPREGRRFVFGFSGGGHMALRLALEAPDTISGVAVIGANLPAPGDSDCKPAGHGPYPSLILINGTDDPINPYRGGMVVMPRMLGGHELGKVMSSEETARYFAVRNNSSDPVETRHGPEADGDTRTSVTLSTWRGPGPGAVTLVTIVGGGHTIPQRGNPFPEVAGRHSQEIDAPRLALQILFTHSKEK